MLLNQNIKRFCDQVRLESKDIRVSVNKIKTLDLVLDNLDRLREESKEDAKKFLADYGVAISPELLLAFQGVSSTILRWSRPEQKSQEGLISGGFSFNGISDIFYMETLFWTESVADFQEYEDDSHIEMAQLQKLRWIESTTSAYLDRNAEYTPQFGCVALKSGGFPDEFYFYDSGLLYKLPFTTYGDYIDALIECVAVRCWQYFYIDPDIIIKKNRGLNCLTWSLSGHTTLGDVSGIRNSKDFKFDRLDLIREYLGRCVTLLPNSFPFADFTKMKNWYGEFDGACKRLE